MEPALKRPRDRRITGGSAPALGLRFDEFPTPTPSVSWESINDLQRPVGTYLYGRGLYEAMTCWETDPTPAARSALTRDFADRWQAAGLVDEYRLFLIPVVTGGGKRFFPAGVRVKLDLLEERRFGNGTVYHRYRTARQSWQRVISRLRSKRS